MLCRNQNDSTPVSGEKYTRYSFAKVERQDGQSRHGMTIGDIKRYMRWAMPCERTCTDDEMYNGSIRSII